MSDRDWCCERLEERTSSPGTWERRTIVEASDGSLSLLSAQAYEGGEVGIRHVPFDYCPFCGEEVAS